MVLWDTLVMKNTMSCLSKNQQEDWNNRLETLAETIEYWLDFETNKLIEVIELFYDSN